jgi:hypothetical protein
MVLVLGLVGAFIRVESVNNSKDVQFSFARGVKDYSIQSIKYNGKLEEKTENQETTSNGENSEKKEQKVIETDQKNVENLEQNSNTDEGFNTGELDQDKTSFEENNNKLKGFVLGDNSILQIPKYESGLIIDIETNFPTEEYDKGIKFLDGQGNKLYLILSNEYIDDSLCTDDFSTINDLNYVEDIEIPGGKQFIKNFYKNGSTEYNKIKDKIFGSEKSFEACYKSNSTRINIGGGLYYYDIVVVGEVNNFTGLIKDIFDTY